MREILFRGKRTENGEWVEGAYLGDYFGDRSLFIIRSDFSNYAVDPITVGQYTGLTDKNGKKIFEGDIVQDIYWPAEKGIVKFEIGTFDSGIYEYVGWVAEKLDGDVDHTPLLELEKDEIVENLYYGYEIIGNIFDNPEFLENSK